MALLICRDFGFWFRLRIFTTMIYNGGHVSTIARLQGSEALGVICLRGDFAFPVKQTK